MLKKRQLWAKENNISPDFIEKLFTTMVEFFISEEMNQWEKEN